MTWKDLFSPTNLPFLYFPFQLTAPLLSKPESQVSSWNLPLPSFLFQSHLQLLNLHNVSHIDFMFPYSHQQRINLYFYYSLLGSLPYPLCPLRITPEHRLLQYFQSCVYKIKIRPGQFHGKKNLAFLCILWNLHVLQELSSNSLAGHLCSCSRRNDNTRRDSP